MKAVFALVFCWISSASPIPPSLTLTATPAPSFDKSSISVGLAFNEPAPETSTFSSNLHLKLSTPDAFKQDVLNKDFKFAIALAPEYADLMEDLVRDVSARLLLARVERWSPTTEDESIIGKFSGPKRDKKDYVEYIKRRRDGLKDKYHHSRCVVLVDICARDSGLDKDCCVTWLPALGKGAPFAANYPPGNEVFKRVAETVYNFTSQPGSRKGFMKGAVETWNQQCNKAGQDSSCVYAVVAYDPVAECDRVYVGKAAGKALVSRWLVSTGSSGTNSHVRDVSQLITATQDRDCGAFGFNDLVYACNVLNTLECEPPTHSKWGPKPPASFNLWLIPIEVVGESGSMLDDREAHWSIQLGAFDPSSGLNCRVDESCRRHLRTCKSCCTKITSILK